MRIMRYLRSYRLFLLLCFTTGITVFIYRLCSVPRHNVTVSSSSSHLLSKRIDKRLRMLREQFRHVNLSMLLQRPASDRSSSVTYRCREWCGGWGDRLRGITSTFILAVLMKRRFYIDMPYPCELTKFLEPNLYNWRSVELESNRSQLHIETTRDRRLAEIIYEKISSTNFLVDWSVYDDIYITTNSDYITPMLANEHVQNQVRLLNFSSIESTQARLFPLIYEYLFRPTSAVMDLVDQLLLERKQLICLHIRVGKNPTMIHDKMLSYRETMMEDMLRFVDQNYTIHEKSMLFITSDSTEINQHILKKYGPSQSLSIPGPIIHIDRLSSLNPSIEQCHGFLKVISDFYVLGECDTLIMARSGFSEWASRRRHLMGQFNELYLYCRGIHRVTGYKWKRPHVVC